jgi:mannose-6-phosphate isomerase
VKDGDVLVSHLSRTPALKPALEALKSVAAESNADGVQASASDSPTAVAERLKTWLWDHALPIWWCFGADHEQGGFHESLAQRDLRPTGASRRARVQARQAHVYATAGLMGWTGPWRAAVRQGLDYLQARYRRPDGLFRALVDATGAPLDDSAVLYDQAFVLLALASAARAEPKWRDELTARGLELLQAIRRVLTHPGGGFLASDGAPAFLANPHMHLFEAALAWEEACDDPAWPDLAGELAELFLGRLYDQRRGVVREIFDASWRPVDAPEGASLEPGHQFEWAWLLGRWASRHEDSRATQAILGLYESGTRGVDLASGLVLDCLFDEFSPPQAKPRLWPQTERVKAALWLATRDSEDAPSRLADANSAVSAMESYFQTPKTGLWSDEPRRPGDRHLAPAPASSFYHIIGAIAAFIGAEPLFAAPSAGRGSGIVAAA